MAYLVRLSVVNLTTGRIELDGDTKSSDEALRLLSYWLDARRNAVGKRVERGERVEYRITFGWVPQE